MVINRLRLGLRYEASYLYVGTFPFPFIDKEKIVAEANTILGYIWYNWFVVWVLYIVFLLLSFWRFGIKQLFPSVPNLGGRKQLLLLEIFILGLVTHIRRYLQCRYYKIVKNRLDSHQVV